MKTPALFISDFGQSMTEFLIAFPILLIAVLAIVQLSLLAQTKLFVEYAAFNAARVAIVQPDNPVDIAESAKLSMMPISPRLDTLYGIAIISDSINTLAELSGNQGTLPLRYTYAREFTDAKVVTNQAQSNDDITVHVDYIALLTIPIANKIIGKRYPGILNILSHYSNADNGWLSNISSMVGKDYFYPLSAEVTLSVEALTDSNTEDPSKCTYSYIDNNGVKHTYTYDEVYQSGTYKNGRPQYHTDKDKTGISRIVHQEC
ncbi:MAG: TadE family protein [bacterium]